VYEYAGGNYSIKTFVMQIHAAEVVVVVVVVVIAIKTVTWLALPVASHSFYLHRNPTILYSILDLL
jgi:hypothetical protein